MSNLRYINLLFILSSIQFFGLFGTKNDSLLIVNTNDLMIILMNILLLFLFINSSNMKLIIIKSPIRYLLYLYFFIIIVVLTMPVRGAQSIIDSFRVARYFLYFPLIPLISYDILVNNNFRFYYKLLFIIGFITTIQIFINAINPEFVQKLFPHLRAREFYKYNEAQRNDLVSQTMLFPYVCALISYLNFIFYKNKTYAILFFLFIIASGLQGFRSYFLLLVFVLSILSITFYKFNLKYLIFIPFILIFIGVIDNTFFNNQITIKFTSIALDFERDPGDGSSFKYRQQRDAVFMLPKFLEQPYLGWGFVYPRSKYGREIGMDPGDVTEDNVTNQSVKTFRLYSVDSGWLSMLNYFGFIGCAFYLFYYLILNLEIFKNRHVSIIFAYSSLSFFVILLFSLITHGGLYSDFGIIPYFMLLSIYFTKYISFN